MADREKVINALGRCESYGYCENIDCPYFESVRCLELLRKDALALILENRPVELVKRKLVTCAECKYWLPMNRFHQDYHPGRGECELNCWVRDSGWFCADGEAKEGNDGP